MSHDTETLPVAHRPGPAAWAQLVLGEARVVVRDTAGLILPIGMPVLILVMNGIGDGADQVLANGSTVMSAIILPLTLSMVAALVGVVNMPSFLASYRKHGILRRLAVTPARPSMVLVSQMAVSLVQFLIGAGLAVTLGVVAFGATLPAAPGWALLAGLGLVGSMYAVGLLIAATARSVNGALAVGLVAFFVMLALGGGFGPVENLPDALATIGERLPFGAASAALSAAWVGQAPSSLHLAVLTAWTVVAGALSAKLFRWT
ncbi:ABC transporter permease [Actinotalea sp. K2]|uniref:ABC transporter permease n=1 Tax=Actinotalea sp. K2 TaxID=2939438 RepID=UPI00201803B1|nr:ABC transporter permease [Actinotalea sp. K2]MCL3861396.1 ABC transporter permease [Actinotalea sp. K2]